MPVPNVQGQGRIPPALSGSHITANGSVTCKAHGGGVLHTVTINAKGASGNTATINIDGAAIAVIDTTSAVGTLTYDIGFQDSLQVVMAAGTAADITVSFY